MSSNIAANVSINVKPRNLKTAVNQVKRLEANLKRVNKSSKATKREFAALKSAFGKVNNQLAQSEKKFTKVNSKVKKLGETAKKTGKQLGGVNKGLGKAGDVSNKTGKSLGFTGLAFGFMGRAAANAANMITDKFIAALENSADLISEVNRLSLFSDTGVENGVVVFGALNNQLERTFNLANKVGQPVKDIATLLKEVEKAAPPNIDTAKLGEMVAKMSTLENKTDIPVLVADIATAMAAFPDLKLEEVSDLLFTFQKATKLNFNQGAKSLAFAAQNANAMNTTAEGLFKFLTASTAASPTTRGGPGRGVKTLISDILKPDTIRFLEETPGVGISMFDDDNQLRAADVVLTEITDKYNEFKAINGRMANEFKDRIKLDQISTTTFLAFADVSEETRDAIENQFLNAPGSFDVAAGEQMKQAQNTLNRFKNIQPRIEIEFAKGIFPQLQLLYDMLEKGFEGSSLMAGLQLFGHYVGKILFKAIEIALPYVKGFIGLFQGNNEMIKWAAIVAVGATVLLGLAAAILPLIGLFYALIYVHETAMLRSLQLQKNASFVTKAYIAMFNAFKRVTNGITKLFRGLGSRLWHGFSGGLKYLARPFVKAGVRGAAFFVAGFRIVAAALLGAGRWMLTVLKTLAVRFGIIGATTGGAFGKGWIAGSSVVIGKPTWFVRVAAWLAARFGIGGGVAGAAFGGAWVAGAATTANNGSWLFRLLSWLAFKFGIGGTVAGVAFGQTYSVGAAKSINSNSWLVRLFAWLAAKFGLGGGASGLTFGTGWVGVSTRIINGKAWLAKVAASLSLKWGAAGATAGGAFSAGYAGVVSAGQAVLVAIRSLFVKLGLLSAAGGLTAGKAYGVSHAIGGTTAIGHPAALAKFFAPQFAASSISGNVHGLLYGGKFSTASVLTGSGPSSLARFYAPYAIGATSAGTTSGTLFGIAFATAVAASAVAIGDIISEILGGQSPLKDIQRRLGVANPQSALDMIDKNFGTNIKETYNIGEAQGGLIGGGTRGKAYKIDQTGANSGSGYHVPQFPPSTSSASPLLTSGQSPAYGINFLPEAYGDTGNTGEGLGGESALDMQDELENITAALEEQFASITSNTESLLLQDDILGESNDALIESILAQDSNTVLLDEDNTLLDTNTDLLGVSNLLLNQMNINVGLEIIELIRGINQMSQLTTTIASVQLMFANLLAQGNRAAGKLASLRVSKSGVFSISDPGVSRADRAYINAAESNLASTRSNQIVLDVNVEINPVITLENGDQESVVQTADDLASELSTVLQKRIAQITA